MKIILINAERPKDISQGYLDPEAEARTYERGQKHSGLVLEAKAVFCSLMPEAIQTALQFCKGGGKMLPLYTFEKLCSIEAKPGLNQNLYDQILLEANFRGQSFAQAFYSQHWQFAHGKGYEATNLILEEIKNLRLGGEPTIIIVTHNCLVEVIVEFFRNPGQPEVPQEMFRPGEVGVLEVDSGGGFRSFELMP